VVLDWSHANAVAYNSELDQIMLSARSFNEIWIIDHSTTSAEAAGRTGGRSSKGGDLLYRWGNPRAYHAGTREDQRLFYQHDAHWIPPGRPGTGHVLVFNNGLGRPGGDYSSVDEIVLPVDDQGHYSRESGAAYGPKGPVWRYTAPIKADFSMGFMSGAQRLPDGNTLICDSESGTVFEVTPRKEVVWTYTYAGLDESEPGGSSPPPNESRSPSRSPEVLSPTLRDELKLSPQQREDLDGLQDEVDAMLAETLTDKQRRRLSERSNSGPGGMVGLVPPGQIMSLSTQASLSLAEGQKQALAGLQRAVDAKLDRFLTADQKARLRNLGESFGRGIPRGPGLGDRKGPGPRPGGGQAGFGTGGSTVPEVSNLVFRAYRYGTDYRGLVGKELLPHE
jgi:hypothetical protein